WLRTSGYGTHSPSFMQAAAATLNLEPSPLDDVLLWSLEETTRQLGGISPRTLRRMITAGDLHTQRIGRRVLVVSDSVHECLDMDRALSHNSSGAGEAVQPGGIRTCQESAKEIRTGSTPTRIRRTGGPVSANEMAELLGEVLGYPSKSQTAEPERKPSGRNGLSKP
ncbi:MAG: helix-turn-helix domain-containing protein, partial [Gammaproteobacteria bacterium]